MNTASPHPTRDDIRIELAGRILADLLRLSTVLGPDAVFRALNLVSPAVPGRVSASIERMSHEVRLEDIDLDQFPIGRVAMAMFEYVHAQRRPIGMELFVFKSEVEHVEDLVLSLQSDYISLFMSDTLHMGAARESGWQALPALCRATGARLCLDMGEVMSLGDIAVLADMTEKSVRNALTATDEAQLKATQREQSIWVENDEARRWLSLRRGFVPTRFEDVSAAPGAHPDALTSLMALGNYLHERWAALRKTPEAVLAELGWPPSKFDYLNAISGNPRLIDPRDCADLARSLLVSESWLTREVLRNLYPRQVEVLLDREREPAAVLHQAMLTAPNDRLCTRVKFILRDGTLLYPIRMKNRQTGKVAFRLSEGGTGGNTIDNTIEVTDEAMMVDMVCEKSMAVRLTSADGSRQGLYRKDGRSVHAVELDGVAI